METYPQFTQGQQVRDRFGNVHTVLFQLGCEVLTARGKRFHPTKIFPV